MHWEYQPLRATERKGGGDVKTMSTYSGLWHAQGLDFPYEFWTMDGGPNQFHAARLTSLKG